MADSQSPNNDNPVTPEKINKEGWIRGIYMVIFFVIYYILWMLMMAVSIFQFISTIFFKESNKNLENFGESIGLYSYEIIRFVSYGTEKKPYPFDTWPTSKNRPNATPR